MFVQSHIQRNRHPLGTTTSATVASSASSHQLSHQHHNRQTPVHHHNHNKYHRRQLHQQHQGAYVENPRATKIQDLGTRETYSVKPKTSRLTAGTSVFGEKSNQRNSFFNKHVNHDEVNRALEALNRTGELVEPITSARDDAELLEQVELVKSRLVSKLAAIQSVCNKIDVPDRRAFPYGHRQRPIVRSTSLIDLNSKTHEHRSTSHGSSLRQRSRTINSILKKPKQSERELTLESNEKWTQINGSLDHIDCCFERGVTPRPASNNSKCLVSGVLDLPRTLWKLWMDRPTVMTNGHAGGSESRLNLRKNLRAAAWFWANFLAFQWETLKQIYLIVKASRGPQPQSEMAASRSEHLATAVQPNVSNHQYADGHSHFYSHRDQNIKYANPSYALVGSIEPRLVEHETGAWACDRHYHEHNTHKYDHHQSPNHVHVHNHVGRANCYGTYIKPMSLECTCSHHTLVPKKSSSLQRPDQCPPLELSSQAVNVQSHNRVIHDNVIPIRQQQQAVANSSEPRWQWHLRHTVDGSPCRRPDHRGHYDHADTSTSLIHRADYQGESFRESHRASVSSPILLESSQELASWHRRELHELRMGRSGLSNAKSERTADWRLGDSSDDLSVISDHEPADQTSFSMDVTDQRIHVYPLQSPARRRPETLVSKRGQYTGWSSIDSEQSTGRYYERQADVHHTTSSTHHSTTNRLVTQSSLTANNTSSISGVGVSSTASLHKHPNGGTGNTRDGAASAVTSSNQQQIRHRRASPLAKVSLAGAKRRLGFKRRGGGLNSLSVHRSEEVFPDDVIGLPQATNQLSTSERRLKYASALGPGSSSLNDSSFESASPFGAPRSPWFNQFRSSFDPKVCFVDGLGAGQIASRQALVSPYLGDIQLGLSDRRGMLEVEVIRVRQLQLKPAAKRLPSPYVKVYLMRDKKCLAKFKTRQVRETLDPLYQQQFIFRDDYSNCVLQVIVWGDYSKKDRKSLMGAVQIYINDLDMSNLVIGWYKLFNAPSMMNSSLASSSKALRQTMSSSRLTTNFSPLPSWQTSSATSATNK